MYLSIRTKGSSQADPKPTNLSHNCKNHCRQKRSKESSWDLILIREFPSVCTGQKSGSPCLRAQHPFKLTKEPFHTFAIHPPQCNLQPSTQRPSDQPFPVAPSTYLDDVLAAGGRREFGWAGSRQHAKLRKVKFVVSPKWVFKPTMMLDFIGKTFDTKSKTRGGSGKSLPKRG